MMKFSAKKVYFITFLFLGACGVKGKPLPPIDPPIIGRGDVTFSDAFRDIQLKNKQDKIQDDWNQKDFPDTDEEK